MTTAPIITITNTKKGSLELPMQFSEPVRPDLICRAVLAIQSRERQAYGTAPEAGQRPSAKLSRRRRDYKGAYGKGISRVPRKTMSRQGTNMNWVGAVAPGTYKGRQAHPPKASKIWEKSINTKENRKAIRSALAAAMEKTRVLARGHVAPEGYPFIIEQSFEDLSKTKDVIATLTKIGLEKELERTSVNRIRAGHAKMRGRKTKQPVGPLLITSGPCKLSKAGLNIPGVDIVEVTSLNAKHLAPGGVCGRLSIFTQAAMEKLKSDNLYV